MLLRLRPRLMPSRPATRLAAVSRHMATSKGMNKEPVDEAPVLFESAYSTRTFVLNRPKVNALDQEMIDLLAPKIKEWESSELCKIIIGTGSGRAFCAGGEVKAVVKNASDDATRQKALDYFKTEFQLDYELATLTKPYVSVMDGITLGGGVGLSAYAPFRIATEKTLWGMPETKIGYAPDVGATFILARADGQLGTYLGLTGNFVHGYEVFRLGFATHFVESRRIPALLERLGALENPDHDKINATISEFHSEPSSPAEEAKQLTVSVGDIRVALDDCFKHNDVEKIFGSLEDLAANGKPGVKEWAQKTRDELELRSPTSLKIALEAIRRAAHPEFKLSDAMQQELLYATAFCSGGSPDFKTGVETFLVQGSKERPQWDPPTLADTPKSHILSTFFSADSPYAPKAPRIDSSDKTKTSTTGSKPSTDVGHRLKRWALPSEAAIQRVVTGKSGDTGAFVGTLDEIVKVLEKRASGSDGVKAGVRSKVEEVIARRGKITEEGWVQWRY